MFLREGVNLDGIDNLAVDVNVTDQELEPAISLQTSLSLAVETPRLVFTGETEITDRKGETIRGSFSILGDPNDSVRDIDGVRASGRNGYICVIGRYGTFIITDSNYKYYLNTSWRNLANHRDILRLSSGETLTETFRVSTENRISTDVTFTIVGTNNAPYNLTFTGDSITNYPRWRYVDAEVFLPVNKVGNIATVTTSDYDSTSFTYGIWGVSGEGATVSHFNIDQNTGELTTNGLGHLQVGHYIDISITSSDGNNWIWERLRIIITEAVGGNNPVLGTVTVSGIAREGETLTADTSNITDEDGLGAFSYEWSANGVVIAGATSSTYELTQSEVGKIITVVVSYTDLEGTDESIASGETSVVSNVNDLPNGVVTISGIAREGKTLTANTDTITDEDGLGAFSYEWLADGVTITGATNSTYDLTQSEVGKIITVVVSYTDLEGTDESIASGETSVVSKAVETPKLVFTGETEITDRKGQTIRGSFSILGDPNDSVSDIDGVRASGRNGYICVIGRYGTFIITNSNYKYYLNTSWRNLANHRDILRLPTGETLTETFRVSTENRISTDVTFTIVGTNNAPYNLTFTGDSITNYPRWRYVDAEVFLPVNKVGNIATVTTSDYDSTSFTYGIWGVSGEGATVSHFNIDQNTGELTTNGLGHLQVGASIDISITSSDGDNWIWERLRIIITEAVGGNNPTLGTVTISGLAREGETLTANTDSITDEDGLGAFSYEWRADGVTITGETNSTYELTQSEVGKVITVVVSYTDLEGTDESIASVETSVVSNVNDLPNGVVTISGLAREGETLTADTDSISCCRMA